MAAILVEQQGDGHLLEDFVVHGVAHHRLGEEEVHRALGTIEPVVLVEDLHAPRVVALVRGDQQVDAGRCLKKLHDRPHSHIQKIGQFVGPRNCAHAFANGVVLHSGIVVTPDSQFIIVWSRVGRRLEQEAAHDANHVDFERVELLPRPADHSHFALALGPGILEKGPPVVAARLAAHKRFDGLAQRSELRLRMLLLLALRDVHVRRECGHCLRFVREMRWPDKRLAPRARLFEHSEEQQDFLVLSARGGQAEHGAPPREHDIPVAVVFAVRALVDILEAQQQRADSPQDVSGQAEQRHPSGCSLCAQTTGSRKRHLGTSLVFARE